MSQENVDLVRRAVDAFNRRDLDAFVALTDDDVEVIPRSAAWRAAITITATTEFAGG